MAEVSGIEGVRERRERHRRAGVSRLGGLDRVHGQGTNCIDRQTGRVWSGSSRRSGHAGLPRAQVRAGRAAVARHSPEIYSLPVRRDGPIQTLARYFSRVSVR